LARCDAVGPGMKLHFGLRQRIAAVVVENNFRMVW
jgi:hypothetical protein